MVRKKLIKLNRFRCSFFRIVPKVEKRFSTIFWVRLLITNLLNLICVEDEKQIRATHQTANLHAASPHLIQEKRHRGDVGDFELPDDRKKPAR